MSIKRSILVRVQFSFVIVAIIAFIVILRILFLQVFTTSKYNEIAKETGLRYREKKATRGNIYGEDGVMLATSIPLYKLAFDPTIAPEEVYDKGIMDLCEKLSNFFEDKTPLQYLRLINDARRPESRRSYVVLNKKLITYLERKEMETWPLFNMPRNKGGVIFEKVDERTYPFQELGKRTVGYINENDEGAGLELAFQKELGGKNGKALYQKITGGEWKPAPGGTRIKPEEGLDIYTTIDINFQDIAHSALKQAVEKHEANFGCVAIMEVKTGKIKAMVNLGRLKSGKYNEIDNFIAGNTLAVIDPGSTFKAASMLAYLEDSNAKLTDTIETGGGKYQYFDRTMRDSRPGGYGKIPTLDAVIVSSNIGVSKLVTKQFGGKNHNRFIDYLKKFHLTEPLSGFGLEGMAKPYMKDDDDPTKSGTTLPWMAIGYEMKVSPLHLLAFYNAIANNGTYIEPFLVKSIKKNGKVVKPFEPIVYKEKIASINALNKMKKMLEGVVERGTAKNIYSKKYKIAGKTGTSQKIINGRYSKKYKTSFAGYFPADNPKYTCIVIIDEPKGASVYGGDVSAPVFRKISDGLYAHDIDVQSKALIARETSIYNVKLPTEQASHIQDLADICEALNINYVSQNDKEWVVPYANKYTVEFKDRKVNENMIPNVRGLTLRDAIYILENMGLKVFYSGKGRVKTQSLMPGSPLRKGEKIVISLR